MEKWFIKNKKGDIKGISERFGINSIVAKLLINRDISNEESIDIFLNPDIDRLHSPVLLKDIIRASNLINDDCRNNRRIRIVGDYDVDGIMSIYILYKGLKRVGLNVDYTVPDRISDGYGINNRIVDEAIEDGIDTIITCDNGISANDTISYAKEKGLKLIITDHHEVPEILPEADAIINPKQKDCKYPFKNICGALVAYKLIDFLYMTNGMENNEIHDLMQYAALATICDVMDIVDENRIIVKKGLEALNTTNDIGLKALIEASGLKDKTIGVYHIGFIIGPCLNATGRLDSALSALDLLLSDDSTRAKEIATSLVELNARRKTMTEDGVNKAKAYIDAKHANDKILLVYEPSIHESIAGIVAGRIKEYYNKPTIVLTDGEYMVKGSARSIEEYNIFEEISKTKDLLEAFGGHPMAAGMSLQKENVDKLRRNLNSNCRLSEDDLIPKVYLDMQLPLNYVNFNLLEEIKCLEPYGKGNSKPLFGEKNLRIKQARILGVNKNVLKLDLLSPTNISFDGIIFSNSQYFIEEIGNKYGKNELNKILKGLDNDIMVDILYYPDINEFNGRTTIQLIIENFRFI